MKPSIFVLRPNEGWIVDRLVQEYESKTSLKITHDQPDIIWLLASWCWNHIHPSFLQSKFVVCTVHHEVPDKFASKLQSFQMRDQFVNVYHVFCQKTANFISQYTRKPVVVLGYWTNPELWSSTLTKEEAKEKLGLPKDSFIISSFQRDTEGSDLITPKLEKGPDVFCDVVHGLKKKHDNLHVLLGGWRRQYVINNLTQNNVQFTYLEKQPFNRVVEMYRATDLYVVGSRFEGGPQAIIECALMKTPIISTDVGVARDYLMGTSLFEIGKSGDVACPSPAANEHAYMAALADSWETKISEYDSLFQRLLNEN